LRENKVKTESISTNDQPLGDFSWPDKYDQKVETQELFSMFSARRNPTTVEPSSNLLNDMNSGPSEQILDELSSMRARIEKLENKLMDMSTHKKNLPLHELDELRLLGGGKRFKEK
jgi:hypothetical protein